MASFSLLRVLLLVATVATNAGWGTAHEAVVTAAVEIKANRPQLLLTGDSITEQATDPAFSGYVLLMQYQLLESFDIIIRGLSGYNSRWWLKYVQPTLNQELKKGKFQPSVITVWLGTNDAVLPNGRNADMHVPLADYTQNLHDIVGNFSAAAPDAHIVMITPPHVDDAARDKVAKSLTDANKGVLDRSNAMAGKYARACVEVAAKVKVPVLDLYTHFNNMTTAKRSGYLQDGLHFSKSGHVVVYNMLVDLIKKEFPEVGKEMDEDQYPFVAKWREEDPWTGANNTVTAS
ncbi:hypothetical protein PHMEG_00028604 [Phytophthora megakarya]|uniref:SGNH hydrolase-type esterase domain-containing protein n=1 Tax=Phytophthora megakarya TaxID=4795 RepID=A0A225V5S7_9STRA|nr:hypothetical protein PHMEG_00028604 [Phytophthora megakarya]